VKRTKALLALLLLLHVVVHPLLHEAPLPGIASGPDGLTAAIVAIHSQSHDCDLCRIASSVVLTVQLPIAKPCDTSPLVAMCPDSRVFGDAHFQLSARAPPAG